MNRVLEHANYLSVLIKSRTKIFFDGRAQSLTSNNDKGVFDILPQHANFISIIKDFIIVDKGLKTEQKFTIKNGVLSVQSNKVDVYLDVSNV
jgi:F0F1-type ATP synthase epsilon subunit